MRWKTRASFANNAPEKGSARGDVPTATKMEEVVKRLQYLGIDPLVGQRERKEGGNPQRRNQRSGK